MACHTPERGGRWHTGVAAAAGTPTSLVFPDQLVVFETRGLCPWGLPLAAGCTVVRPEQLLGILGLLGHPGGPARPLLGILTVNPATDGRDRPIIG